MIFIIQNKIKEKIKLNVEDKKFGMCRFHEIKICIKMKCKMEKCIIVNRDRKLCNYIKKNLNKISTSNLNIMQPIEEFQNTI